MQESAMVLNSARRYLSKLAPIAEELNRASDAFTDELRTIESELGKLNLGVEVSLRTSFYLGQGEEEETSGGEFQLYFPDHYLAYGRHGDDWRILVHTYKRFHPRHDRNDAELIDITPLVGCSREIRVASAAHVEALLQAVEKAAIEKVDSLKKVIDKAPEPSAWKDFLHGIDENEVVHAMKRNAPGKTLCGATVISTSFSKGRPCPTCDSLVKTSPKK